MTAAWLVANAVPFFDGLVELIGSICATAFFLPGLLFRRAWTLHTQGPLRTTDNFASVGLMALAVVLTLSGLTGAVLGIIGDWAQYGSPFSCHAV